ncbi:hypothetical protein [Pantoea sp. SORGH_AS_0659]|nr:hypothetical protein [Pantoea sp. SORGH_AS_0659]MDR6352469.1 hypothetical protein [Pantoea sp. SORGH_AS_0659]
MAGLMNLVEKARLNSLAQRLWLRHMLEELPLWPTSRLDERLP